MATMTILTVDAILDDPRLAACIEKALDTFGDHQQAMGWLLCPNPALKGLRPADVALRPGGEEDVLDVLGRIDHGIFE